MANEEAENTVVPAVDSWVAENYEALVADEDRNLTFKDIAKRADDEGDKNLAAWARSRAAGKGKDVTPKDAESAPSKVVRVAPQKNGDSKEVTVPTVSPDEAAPAAIASKK